MPESDGISIGYPGLKDSSVSDISLAVDDKNDPGMKLCLFQKDSIYENEVAREKRRTKNNRLRVSYKRCKARRKCSFKEEREER